MVPSWKLNLWSWNSTLRTRRSIWYMGVVQFSNKHGTVFRLRQRLLRNFARHANFMPALIITPAWSFLRYMQQLYLTLGITWIETLSGYRSAGIFSIAIKQNWWQTLKTWIWKNKFFFNRVYTYISVNFKWLIIFLETRKAYFIE